MKTVNIPAKACPVVDEVDVLVVGGGAAGIGAAIGAAQCGASVALVEYFGALGGLLTNGYVTNCEAGVAISGDKILIKGVFDKLVTRMVEKGGAIRGYDLIRSNKYYPFDTSRCENDLQITPWDPEAFKLSADELMAEHGVKVYFYTQFTEILKEGNKVVGGVIENRSGRQVILAKRVVDCTGAAAVAQMAGAECCGVGRKGSMTLMFRVGNVKNVVPSYKPNVKEIPYGAVNFFPLIREGDFRVEMTRYIGSENSAEDYTKGTIECRRQCQEVLQYLKEHWIGFEDAYIIDTAPTLGSLAQPALVGEKKMTQEMILKREMPDDRIAITAYGIDLHSPEMGGQNFLYYLTPGEYYGVPFGVVDLSLAPTPAVGDSVARILEEMGLETCGTHGTTAALALLNDAVKKGGLMASSSVGGLSGAFIPVSEDEGMIAAARSGVLTLDKLEAMTCVCSVGLDMIAVPGDTSAETISAIIADEAAVGMVNSKTTAVRLIPAPGKTVGDEVSFGGLLGAAPIMPVHPESSADFIARGGRIPAPMQSLKN